MPSASNRPAAVRAPVAATTSASAFQWSWWRCVVTTVASRSPTVSSSAGASAAASISNCSSLARQRSR